MKKNEGAFGKGDGASRFFSRRQFFKEEDAVPVGAAAETSLM